MIVSALVLTALTGGLLATQSVFAVSENGQDTLVTKIAEKFKLNKTEVQAVFDANRSERMESMEAKYEERLKQLVTDKKITEAQKTLLLAKHEELQAAHKAEMVNNANLTQEQRKAKRDTEKKSQEDWARVNNVDIQYLFGGFGMGGHGALRISHRGMGR